MHFHPANMVPFVSWLRVYKRQFIKADLIAGLTVAVVALPQAMASALIAGLPVQYGLYASIVPTIIGCLWGSSSHLITGPTTAVSLVVFSALTPMAASGSQAYIELAFFLAILVGLVQMIMGIARLGALLNFISHAVLIGVTAGAAVLIAFKQVPDLLGLKLENTSVFYEHLWAIATHMHETQWISLALGVGTIVIILGFKRYLPKWPGTLAAMIVTGAMVALFDLDQRGVAVVGAIPAGLPLPHIPSGTTFGAVGLLSPAALAIAILGSVEAISIAKSIADQTRQRLDVNREFMGQGLANVAAGLFGGYAGSGSFVRSAVNFNSGARTPMSGIFSGIAVAATVLLAGPLAAKLPLSALAGVIIVIARSMIHEKEIVHIIKTTRSDAAVLCVTFLATMLLNIEFAIYVGVLLSIGLHLAATSHPRIYSVVPDSDSGKMVGQAFGETCCQMDIVTVEGSLFFGSADYVADDLQRRLRNHPDMANLLIRMHKVNTLDASGVHVLELVLEELKRRGGGLYFSGLNHRVFQVFKNAGLLFEVGEMHIRTSTGSAVRRAMQENFCPGVCAACPVVVFRECPDLKKGNWEIFGSGVQPRSCRINHISRDEAETAF